MYRLLGGVKCTLDVLSVSVVRWCEGGTKKGGNFKSAILNFMKVQQIFSRRCPATDGPPSGCVLHVTLSWFQKKSINHALT